MEPWGTPLHIGREALWARVGVDYKKPDYDYDYDYSAHKIIDYDYDYSGD